MQLHNDDCEIVLSKLSHKSIDLIITSPPYNLNVKYNNYKDKREDYIKWLSKILNLCCKVLKDDGHLFINLSSSKDEPFTAYKVVEQLDWVLQNNIIWAKSI